MAFLPPCPAEFEVVAGVPLGGMLVRSAKMFEEVRNVKIQDCSERFEV